MLEFAEALAYARVLMQDIFKVIFHYSQCIYVTQPLESAPGFDDGHHPGRNSPAGRFGQNCTREQSFPTRPAGSSQNTHRQKRRSALPVTRVFSPGRNPVDWPPSGIYNLSPADHCGLGEDSLVIVKVEDGKWKSAE